MASSKCANSKCACTEHAPRGTVAAQEAWTEHLLEHNYALWDGFLGSSDAAALLHGARALDDKGLLHVKSPARPGSALGALGSRLRQDRGLSLVSTGATLLCMSSDNAPCQHFHRRIGEALEALRHTVDPLLEAAPDSLQLAHYPGGGAHYMAHKDRDQTSPMRSLSFVYYLNEREPRWNISEHGGALHLYAAGSEEQLSAVVAPTHDRLVTFNSELYHEVRPCYRSRFALNAWVNSRRAMSPASLSPISVASIVRLVRGVLPLALTEAAGEDGGVGAATLGSEADVAPSDGPARQLAVLAEPTAAEPATALSVAAAAEEEGPEPDATSAAPGKAALLARIASARTESSSPAVAVPVSAVPWWYGEQHVHDAAYFQQDGTG